MVRFRDWVSTTFLDRNVDPGTCLTWPNHGVQFETFCCISSFCSDEDEKCAY